jgi:hypothetical protein
VLASIPSRRWPRAGFVPTSPARRPHLAPGAARAHRPADGGSVPPPPGTAARRTDSPLDHLPANVEVLTRFGERADISPDDRRVAFMAKSFGDAFVIDLATRAIRCLTCNVPGAAFLRVMHLASGD